MRRREFITVLGGAAAWSGAVRGAAARKPVIGYLGGASLDGYATDTAAFRQGLSEMGYAEGRNVEIEFRSADNHVERLPTLAAELVQRGVAVIFAVQGSAPAV